MPGSGLGLGLAQRMVEILGGKLAIASTLGQGTLVHVEVPLHLLSTDHESDQEDLQINEEDENAQQAALTRRDGILLAGFSNSKTAGIRRVGKCLLRQLKHNLCRVVTEAQYASLIVAPVGVLASEAIARLVSSARPGVELILLDQSRLNSSSLLSSLKWPRTTDVETAAASVLDKLQITVLHRPLTPSLVNRIMEPPAPTDDRRETFKSDVVGGPVSGKSPDLSSQAIANGMAGLSMRRQISGRGSGSEHSNEQDNKERPSYDRGSSFTMLNPSPGLEKDDFDTRSHSSTSSRQLNVRHSLQTASAAKAVLDPNEDATALPGPMMDLLPSLPFRPSIEHHQASDPFPLFGSKGKEKADTGEEQADLSARPASLASERDLERSDEERPKLHSSTQSAPMVDLADMSSLPSPSSQPSPSSSRLEATTLKVLVVEDNAVNRKILTMMLKKTVSLWDITDRYC